MRAGFLARIASEKEWLNQVLEEEVVLKEEEIYASITQQYTLPYAQQRQEHYQRRTSNFFEKEKREIFVICYYVIKVHIKAGP